MLISLWTVAGAVASVEESLLVAAMKPLHRYRTVTHLSGTFEITLTIFQL